MVFFFSVALSAVTATALKYVSYYATTVFSISKNRSLVVAVDLSTLPAIPVSLLEKEWTVCPRLELLIVELLLIAFQFSGWFPIAVQPSEMGLCQRSRSLHRKIDHQPKIWIPYFKIFVIPRIFVMCLVWWPSINYTFLNLCVFTGLQLTLWRAICSTHFTKQFSQNGTWPNTWVLYGPVK